jgi:hypothetical protein
MDETVTKEEKALLLNQAKCLVRMLQPYSLNSGVPTNLTSQNVTLFRKARSIYGKEVDTYVADPPTATYSRASTVRSSATSLVSYLEMKMGDPVASQLIGNELETARWALKQGLPICAVLLCRVVQEQTMRRLCDRTGIEYAPDTQPSTLAQKLRDDNGGPFEKHVWKSIDAKLTFEGEVLHARVKPEIDEVRDLIDWTDKFSQKLVTVTSI